MNQDKLQQELREKIKPGIKPSDLKKKPLTHNIPTPPPTPPLKPRKEGNSPPPISIKPEIKTLRDENLTKTPDKAIIKQLQEAVNYWKTTAQIHLTNLQSITAELDQAEEKIKALESNPAQLNKETEQALKEANEKIRELETKIKTDNENYIKQINLLKNQANNQISTKKETKEQATQTEPTFFFCDNCQQNKHGNYTIRKIDSPFEPRTHGKFCYICSTCRKYTKEYNEKADWKEEDNPYKIN